MLSTGGSLPEALFWGGARKPKWTHFRTGCQSRSDRRGEVPERMQRPSEAATLAATLVAEVTLAKWRGGKAAIEAKQ